MPTEFEIREADRRHWKISTLRNGTGLTYARIGEMYGFTKERARQLVRAGNRKKLRYMKDLEKRRITEYFNLTQ